MRNLALTYTSKDGDKTQEKLITKRMKTMCRAYGMLAGQVMITFHPLIRAMTHVYKVMEATTV